MKEIPLSNSASVALVDDEDYDWLMQWTWRYRIEKGYAYRTSRVTERGKCTIYMHRVIVNAPKGVKVDHHNGNGLDNTRLNLRLATNAQNTWNSRKMRRGHLSSQYKGVSYVKRRGTWRVGITVNGKRIFIGSFASEEEGALAYNQNALLHHKEFAWLNSVRMK